MSPLPENGVVWTADWRDADSEIGLMDIPSLERLYCHDLSMAITEEMLGDLDAAIKMISERLQNGQPISAVLMQVFFNAMAYGVQISRGLETMEDAGTLRASMDMAAFRCDLSPAHSGVPGWMDAAMERENSALGDEP
jgi:hypothetical protein